MAGSYLVTAVDAIASESYPMAQASREVYGLMMHLTLTEVRAFTCRRRRPKLIRVNKMPITKYVFAIYAIPVRLTGRLFPFRLIKGNAGAANADIVSVILRYQPSPPKSWVSVEACLLGRGADAICHP
jgi:hypothetical protein